MDPEVIHTNLLASVLQMCKASCGHTKQVCQCLVGLISAVVLTPSWTMIVCHLQHLLLVAVAEGGKGEILRQMLGQRKKDPSAKVL